MKEYGSFYKTVTGNEGNLCYYTTRLDTYGCGCAHDCSYCYAKSLLSFRGLWDPADPRVADINKIKRKIKKMPDKVVRLGGMTDCFQPIEIAEGITYETIKALNDAGIHYLIVTKSTHVADDKYMQLYNKDLAHIQISISTTDDAFAKTYEQASSVSHRIKAVQQLQGADFDASLRVAPYLTESLDVRALNAVKIKKVLVEFLRVNHWIKKWMDIDFSDYTLKHGGYLHLPLEKKLHYLKDIECQELSVCDDVPGHYEYFKSNINHNKNDCCNINYKGTD